MRFSVSEFLTLYPVPMASADGLRTFLNLLSSDSAITEPSHAAYILATVKHECADTWRPIVERGPIQYFDKYEQGQLKVWLGNDKPGDGYRYRGRGYGMLTGRRNYRLFGRLLGVQLEERPELAQIPKTSYAILSLGMRQGLFTGRKLSAYLNEQQTDYIQARRVINGLDRADLIAGYAAKFLPILRASQHTLIHHLASRTVPIRA